MSAPDWSSRTGKTVRALDVPEPGECGCDASLIPCGCTEPCDCLLRPRPPCEHMLDRDHDLALEKWARLLSLFDPEEYDDPPTPPSKALMLSHEDSVAVMSRRWGPKERGGDRGRHLKGTFRLRHPEDVYPTHEAADAVSIRGELCRREGELKTNPLSPLERTLLESLEAQVLPAYHLWPWVRAGMRYLPAAARALSEIRDRRLFRELRLTFELYAFDVFGFQAQDLDAIFASVQSPPATLPMRRAA